MLNQNFGETQGLRLCVYTALIGGYEKLNEQAVAAQSAIPFICLTDDPDLRSETWQIRRIPPVFAMDPIRSQRDLKIRPHVHLPDFDVSLYIDNSVLLAQPPESLFEQYFPVSGICLPEHSFRDSTMDEFLEVSRLGFDDQSRIFEQLNHYLLDCPDVLQQKPYWAAILLRDHRNEQMRKMAEIWVAHVQRYSRRDQLSVNLALRQAGLIPDCMKIDNLASWFHSWPHVEGRDRHKGMRCLTSTLTPPLGRIRQLELALAEQSLKHERAMAEISNTLDAQRQLLAEQAQQHQQVMGEQQRCHEEILAGHRQQYQQSVVALNAYILALKTSTSWRITSPLRWSVRGLKCCASAVRLRYRVGLDQLSSWYGRIPVVKQRRIRTELVKRYQQHLGLVPRLNPPVSFNEHILHRILYDRDPRLKIICDKLAVRDFIRQRVGPEFLVPVLGVWQNPSDIAWERLPQSFVLKPSHASGPVLLIPAEADRQFEDWAEQVKGWLDYDYFDISYEWGYRGIPRRLLAEPLLKGADGGPPVEVQVMTFSGKAAFIRVFSGGKLSPEMRDNWFDAKGNRLPFRVLSTPGDYEFSEDDLKMLVPLAERVSEGFSHLRVDFYLTDVGPKIGELTAYHIAGLAQWNPLDWDEKLGQLFENPDSPLS